MERINEWVESIDDELTNRIVENFEIVDLIKDGNGQRILTKLKKGKGMEDLLLSGQDADIRYISLYKYENGCNRHYTLKWTKENGSGYDASDGENLTISYSKMVGYTKRAMEYLININS